MLVKGAPGNNSHDSLREVFIRQYSDAVKLKENNHSLNRIYQYLCCSFTLIVQQLFHDFFYLLLYYHHFWWYLIIVTILIDAVLSQLINSSIDELRGKCRPQSYFCFQLLCSFYPLKVTKMPTAFGHKLNAPKFAVGEDIRMQEVWLGDSSV